jgi:hypothetical protein
VTPIVSRLEASQNETIKSLRKESASVGKSAMRDGEYRYRLLRALPPLVWTLAPPFVFRGPEVLGKLRRYREVAPPIGTDGVTPAAIFFASDLRRASAYTSCGHAVA